MPFGDFKTLGEALRLLQVTEMQDPFVEPKPFSPGEHYREWLHMVLNEIPVECSEWAVCENLIYPTLREIHKAYAKDLALWSHVPMYRDGVLQGIPDYQIAKRSPLSIHVMEPPLAMVVEAKRNDFDAGWGQCVGAMNAAQAVNGCPERIIFGGVSDGFMWRFGKLQGRTLVRHPALFSLSRLDELLAALNYVFDQCRQQVLIPAEAA